MKNAIIKKTLYIIIAFIMCSVCGQYVVYGQFFCGDWTRKAKQTLQLEHLECQNIELNDGRITTITNDAQIYFEVPQNTKYICLNFSEIEATTKRQYLSLYIPTSEGYTEEKVIKRKFRDGNNVFYDEKGFKGIIRIDIGESEDVTYKLNRVEYSDKLVMVPEAFIIALTFIIILFLISYIIYRIKHKHFLINRKHLYFVMFFLFYYFIWSIVVPYNQGPDELMRYDVAQYIYNNNSLPRGDEPILCAYNGWGTSYAYSPYLAYLLCAVFMKIGASFGLVGIELLHVARLVSVLSATVTVYLLIRISRELEFRNEYFLSCMVGLLPQYSFVASYVNNDSFAIMTTALIIYAWILGIKSNWDKKSCTFFVVGMALCVAAYYNCYGYLLVSLLLFISTFLLKFKAEKNSKIFLVMFRKGIIIFLCVFLISGWWFIRNYYLYGDFFGTEAAEVAKMKYALDWLKPGVKQSLFEQGVSFGSMLFAPQYEWLKISCKSFVAAFGYMALYMPEWVYNFYLIMVSGGCLMCVFANKGKEKWNLIFRLSLVCSFIIVLGLSLIYSYYSDFQPQGRYLLPLIIPLMIYVTRGIEKFDALFNITKIHIDDIIIFVIFIINMYAIWITIFPYYYW